MHHESVLFRVLAPNLFPSIDYANLHPEREIVGNASGKTPTGIVSRVPFGTSTPSR
jgi:hypothetical protein